MTEPCSTGIGGDMFCLFYDAKTRKISALNGSGRSGNKYTLERIRKSLGVPDGEQGNIPMDSVHAVSVPGAAAGWCDSVARFGSGRVSMEQILAPAIELGEKGFPVSEGVAYWVGCWLAPTLNFILFLPRLTPYRYPHNKLLSRCFSRLGTSALMITKNYSGINPNHSSAAPHPTAARC